MNGRRARILRKQAKKMTVGQPARKQVVAVLPERPRWVEVPNESGDFLTRLRNRFLRSIGLPVPMRRERRLMRPEVVVEQRGTTRWAYKRLKRMYYRLRAA